MNKNMAPLKIVDARLEVDRDADGFCTAILTGTLSGRVVKATNVSWVKAVLVALKTAQEEAVKTNEKYSRKYST